MYGMLQVLSPFSSFILSLSFSCPHTQITYIHNYSLLLNDDVKVTRRYLRRRMLSFGRRCIMLVPLRHRWLYYKVWLSTEILLNY